MSAPVRIIGDGISQPFELMKFTLVYDGDLPSSGNKSKPAYAATIRNDFHDQLADLWDTHIVLRQLARTARVPKGGKRLASRTGIVDVAPAYEGPIRPVTEHEIDLCGPIPIPGSVNYIPFVRGSLHLVCTLDILFLRREDPGALVFQGGDLDGRIKTLFDGLRMPSAQEADASGVAPTADPIYCLLQEDTLISDFSIKTGRLLGKREQKVHAVRLWIDVSVKVLRVTEENMCLLSD
jgi:hypothetical protein